MEKRNTSIITIVLLIILIVLVAAVGVYMVIRDNKPLEGTNNNNNEAIDNVLDENEEQKEEAKEVSLDSKVAKLILAMTKWCNVEYIEDKYKIEGTFPKDSFYGFNSDKIDITYFDNKQLHSIAWDYMNTAKYSAEYEIIKTDWNSETGLMHVSQDTMKKLLTNVFGSKISYTPVSFNYNFNTLGNYSEDKKEFTFAGTGGGPRPYIAQKITKINEYSNTYEAYIKVIMCTIETEKISEYTLGESHYIYMLKDGTTIRESVATENFDISNHLDNAYEFKHTFGKNEDGSIYWISTEKVK